MSSNANDSSNSNWDTITATFLSSSSASNASSSTPINIFKKRAPSNIIKNGNSNGVITSKQMSNGLTRQSSTLKSVGSVAPKPIQLKGTLPIVNSQNSNIGSSSRNTNHSNVLTIDRKDGPSKAFKDTKPGASAPELSYTQTPQASNCTDSKFLFNAGDVGFMRCTDGDIDRSPHRVINSKLLENQMLTTPPASITKKTINNENTFKQKQPSSQILLAQDDQGIINATPPAFQSHQKPTKPSLPQVQISLKKPQQHIQPLTTPTLKLPQSLQTVKQSLLPLPNQEPISSHTQPKIPQLNPKTSPTSHNINITRQYPSFSSVHPSKSPSRSINGDSRNKQSDVGIDLQAMALHEQEWKERALKHQKHISEVIQIDVDAETALNAETDKLDHIICQLRVETARVTAKSLANQQMLLEVMLKPNKGKLDSISQHTQHSDLLGFQHTITSSSELNQFQSFKQEFSASLDATVWQYHYIQKNDVMNVPYDDQKPRSDDEDVMREEDYDGSMIVDDDNSDREKDFMEEVQDENISP